MSEKTPARATTTIDQPELDVIIAKHMAFKDGRASGVRALLRHYDLSGLSFKGMDMSNADMSGSIMVETNFERCNLNYAVLYACDLRKANFSYASLLRADLRGACMRGAVMKGANMEDADLREGSYATFDPDKGLTFTSDSEAWRAGRGGADMRGANLSCVKLSGAIAINTNFEDADMSKSTILRGELCGANMCGTNLAGADLSQCNLKNVNLRGANLTGTLLDFSTLENVDLAGTLTDQPAGTTLNELSLPFEELLKLHQTWLRTQGEDGQRLDFSNFDLRTAPGLSGANLTMLFAEHAVWYGHDLSNVNLQAASLKNSDFRHCHFNASDIRGTNFSKCTMVGSKFLKARMEPLYFEGCRKLKTCFSGANLRYGDFTGAVLRDVDFTGADLSFANFARADLSGAIFDGAIMHEVRLKETS